MPDCLQRPENCDLQYSRLMDQHGRRVALPISQFAMGTGGGKNVASLSLPEALERPSE